jgi:hypothetical protein
MLDDTSQIVVSGELATRGKFWGELAGDAGVVRCSFEGDPMRRG